MEIIGYNTNDGYEYEFLVCEERDNNLFFVKAFETYKEASDFIKTVKNARLVHNVRVSHKQRIE